MFVEARIPSNPLHTSPDVKFPRPASWWLPHCPSSFLRGEATVGALCGSKFWFHDGIDDYLMVQVVLPWWILSAWAGEGLRMHLLFNGRPSAFARGFLKAA